MYTNDELYHHGVIGQKWGVRRTAAQLGHKVKSTLPGGKKKSDETKEGPQQFTNHAKKGESYVKSSNRTRKNINDIIDSGDAALVYKNRKHMSNNDLQQAINRINNENTLKRMAGEQKQDMWSKADEFNKTVKRVNDYVDTGVKLYDNYKKVESIKNGTYKPEKRKEKKDK